jgi:hypothetical protein
MARAVTVATMKSAVAVLLIAATIWCYPLAAEGTFSACDALASQALQIEAKPNRVPNESDSVTLIKSLGDYFVSETVRRRYPLLPSGIVCAGYYWRLLADPDFIATIESPNDAE